MQKEFTEKLGEVWQHACKPATELADLNIRTLGRWSKDTNLLNEFLQAKGPKDIISAQIKMATLANSEAIKYAQEASKICMEAASEAGKVFTDLAQETTKAAQAHTRTNPGSKAKE